MQYHVGDRIEFLRDADEVYTGTITQVAAHEYYVIYDRPWNDYTESFVWNQYILGKIPHEKTGLSAFLEKHV